MSAPQGMAHLVCIVENARIHRRNAPTTPFWGQRGTAVSASSGTRARPRIRQRRIPPEHLDAPTRGADGMRPVCTSTHPVTREAAARVLRG
ncbi:uncharacterized protein TRAVEDRAFT_29723, partial [Trametes versicolor FP-101664 SS1]|uniref:uncharacterized protein n=1 Tax=Trametes versicolor (strain FP-101664) TaxID=717944 RepID=UPI000462136B